MSQDIYEELEKKFKELPVFHKIYPLPKEDLSLFTTIKEVIPDLQNDAIQQMALIKRAITMLQTPIICVCGTANSGKSTIVSLFLSEEGKKRILIGGLSDEGTHRFAFWLPASWKGSSLENDIKQLINETTQHDAEELSDDPQKAAAQYNARRSRKLEFEIPLLAFDHALDKYGMGFLDCPDIQRTLDDTSIEASAYKRGELLGTTIRCCSAFVLVVDLNQHETETVNDLLKILQKNAPSMPFYYIINKVKKEYTNEDIDGEISKRFKNWEHIHTITRSYFAHYQDNRDINIKPVRRGDKEFSVILEEINPAEMQKLHLSSRIKQTKEQWENIIESIQSISDEGRQTAEEVWKTMKVFLTKQYVTTEGTFRIPSGEKVASAIANKIMEGAPWLIRKLDRIPKKFKGGFSNLPKKYIKKNDLKPGMGNIVSANDFADYLYGRKCTSALEKEDLLKIWNAVDKCVREFSNKQIVDPSLIDQVAKKVWAEMPWPQKFKFYERIFVVSGILFGAGALLPFDGGIVSVPLAGSMVLGAGEMFAILLGTFVAAVVNYPQLTKMREIIDEIAAQQLGMLFTLLLDGIGIPVPDDPKYLSLEGSLYEKPLPLPTQQQRDSLKVEKTKPIVTKPILQKDKEKMEELKLSLSKLS